MANVRLNTTGFEQGLLEEATVQHLHDLEKPLLGTALPNPRPAPKHMCEVLDRCMDGIANERIMTGKTLLVNCRSVVMGDVVLYRTPDPHRPLGIDKQSCYIHGLMV